MVVILLGEDKTNEAALKVPARVTLVNSVEKLHVEAENLALGLGLEGEFTLFSQVHFGVFGGRNVNLNENFVFALGPLQVRE